MTTALGPWAGPMLIVLFLVSYFNFFVCSVWYILSWLPVSFLLHVKYTLSYRITITTSAKQHIN